MRTSPKPPRRMAKDPIGRYLDYVRRYALVMTMRAEAEARRFATTGEHQELKALFHVHDDARTTQLRLERYEQWLIAASQAGRYTGSTTLRRVLPDGTTEPWAQDDTPPLLPRGPQPSLRTTLPAPLQLPASLTGHSPPAGVFARLRASAHRLIEYLSA